MIIGRVLQGKELGRVKGLVSSSYSALLMELNQMFTRTVTSKMCLCLTPTRRPFKPEGNLFATSFFKRPLLTFRGQIFMRQNDCF